MINLNTKRMMDTTNRNTGKTDGSGQGGVTINPISNGSISQAPPTVWSTLTDNKLATPDVYGGVQSGTMGTMTAKHAILNAGGAGGGLAGLLSGGLLSGLNGILGGLGDINGAISKGIEFYKQVEQTVLSGGDPLSRAANILGVSTSGLNSMIGNGGALSSIMAGMDPTNSIMNTLSQSSNMLLKLGDEVKQLSNIDFKDLSQATGLINKISQGLGIPAIAVLSDNSGRALFTADVVNRLTSLGVPDVIKSVEKLFTSDSNAWELLIKNVLPESIRNADINGLLSIADLIGTKVDSLSAHDFINKVMNHYKYDNRLKLNDKTKEFENIVTLFNKANGLKWLLKDNTGKFDTNGKFDSKKDKKDSHIDIRQLNNASKDFKDLWLNGVRNIGNDQSNLSDDELNKKLSAMVSLYPKMTTRESIKRYFPLAFLDDNIVKSNNVISPVNLGKI